MVEELKYAQANGLDDSELLPYLCNGISAKVAHPFIKNKINGDCAIKALKSGKSFSEYTLHHNQCAQSNCGMGNIE